MLFSGVIISLIHQWKHGIVSNKASSISESDVLATHSKVALFAPPIGPRIAKDPILLALSCRVTFDLGPPTAICSIGWHSHLSKTDKGNGVIWTTELRATAETISVVDDSTDVMLDAFVDSEGYCNDTLARELFEVTCCNMVVCLELIDLEEHWRNWHLISFIIV